jgi:hypothetical protein
MKRTSPNPDQEDPHPSETAYGASTSITPQTPLVVYQGEMVHFCGEGFRHAYTEDPLNSCLASRLLSGK